MTLCTLRNKSCLDEVMIDLILPYMDEPKERESSEGSEGSRKLGRQLSFTLIGLIPTYHLPPSTMLRSTSMLKQAGASMRVSTLTCFLPTWSLITSIMRKRDQEHYAHTEATTAARAIVSHTDCYCTLHLFHAFIYRLSPPPSALATLHELLS